MSAFGKTLAVTALIQVKHYDTHLRAKILTAQITKSNVISIVFPFSNVRAVNNRLIKLQYLYSNSKDTLPCNFEKVEL